jgi:HK97 family phage portal protein
MLFERRSRTQMADPEESARNTSGRSSSKAGQPITPEIALTVSAVLAAFTILSEDISSLPLILYERNGRNKNRAYGNRYYKLLHDQPNPEQTSMIYRELIQGHMLAWGNHYSQIVTNSAGDATALWPLRPDRMSVSRIKGEKVYLYQSSAGGKPRLFFADEILHIPAFGFDGLVGYSRITLARNAIGLSLAAETYGSKFFTNDARPSVVIKHPGQLGETALNNIRDTWFDEHGGVENSNKPAVLEEGMDVATIGLPPEDAQFLETRKFQVSEIARIFRVPPHMIGDVEKTTSWGTGIDSQEQGYINHTLRPWMVRTEQGLNTQVLLSADRETMYFEHLIDGLLRGDLAARYQAYTSALTNGIMSPNEVREKENLNPYQGGDEYYHPLNIGTNQSQAPRAQSSALDPLIVEAGQRIIKRERNDLLGAARRFLGRGQNDQFRAWVDQFYTNDHPAFVRKQFGAIFDAQRRLTGSDSSALLNSYLSCDCQARKEWALEASLERIEEEASTWDDPYAPLLTWKEDADV